MAQYDQRGEVEANSLERVGLTAAAHAQMEQFRSLEPGTPIMRVYDKLLFATGARLLDQ